MIEYQLPPSSMKYSKCLPYPYFLLCNIITTFLNSRISANHDNMEGHSVNGEFLMKKSIIKSYLV